MANRDSQLAKDPRNTFWAGDKTKFGYLMMKKMGWTEGDGLGKNSQGMTSHVKPKATKERNGIGSDELKHDWTSNNKDFNSVLANLSAAYKSKEEKKNKKRKRESKSDSDEEESETEKKKESDSDSDSEKSSNDSDSSDSEEEKKVVKNSHLIYSKRHKAKTVKNYSEKDLAAILVVENEGPKKKEKEESEDEEIVRPSFELITSTKTSEEYFKSKKEVGQKEEVKKSKKRKSEDIKESKKEDKRKIKSEDNEKNVNGTKEKKKEEIKTVIKKEENEEKADSVVDKTTDNPLSN